MIPSPSDASVSQEIGAALWADACLAIDLAARVLKEPPEHFPTFCIKGQPGPVIDTWVDTLAAALPTAKIKRMPTNISAQQLIGGLDLHATLLKGERTVEKGLLTKADKAILLLPSAQLLDAGIVTEINTALDRGYVQIERDGISQKCTTKFGLIILDESEADEQGIAASLLDRATFHLDLSHVSIRDIRKVRQSSRAATQARALCPPEKIKDICAIAIELGLSSTRPARQAMMVAMSHAGLSGRKTVEQDDVAAALRLCLLHRADTLPVLQDDTEEYFEEPEKNTKDDQQQENQRDLSDIDKIPDEMDVETLSSLISKDIISQFKFQSDKRAKKHSTGHAGVSNKNYMRGRPLGSQRGSLNAGKHLDIPATLRAAAPWQKLRKNARRADRRIIITTQDFHIKRFVKPSETTMIFVVDASGSTALNRLNEAKGAIEILLAESYARRDHVAMICVRSRQSEVILPPTRSLTRARCLLTGLRGGGGTPLAHGLQTAISLAQEERRRGRSPALVLLTDGSANITLSGEGDRKAAREETLKMARAVKAAGEPALLIDISRLSNGHAQALADEMDAHLVSMPFASAKNISSAVSAGRSLINR